MGDAYDIGQILNQRYRILKPLGSGGMSQVFLAEDLNLSLTKVAIKSLSPEFRNDPVHVQRFQQEILLTRKINSPYVVKTFEAFLSTDSFYYVMEYLEGVTLKDLLEGAELSLSHVSMIIASIVCGLEAIHQVGIIHRDLKPENIIITSDGQLKIMDFGVAKNKKSELTQSGELIGSASYISPEVWKGGEVSDRSDIYSLGVIAYQLFCHRLPFDGETNAQIMYQHLEGEILPPKKLNAEIPAAMNDLILSMLEIDPKGRPGLQKIREVTQRLGDICLIEAETLDLTNLGKLESKSELQFVDVKIQELKSNSYDARKFANLKSASLVKKIRPWVSVIKAQSLQEIDFSLIRLLLAISLTIVCLVLVAILDTKIFSSGGGASFSLHQSFSFVNYFSELCFFALLISFPLMTITYATSNLFNTAKILIRQFFIFFILLLLINFAYVFSYLDQSIDSFAVNSPLFLAYLQLTLPKAIQNLIDALLFLPVATTAFLSQANSWNINLVELFNLSPVSMLLHYASIVVLVASFLFLNQENLRFLSIAEERRVRLPLLFLVLILIEVAWKQILVSLGIWSEKEIFFTFLGYDFAIDSFSLLCSLINWSAFFGFLLFMPRQSLRAKDRF